MKVSSLGKCRAHNIYLFILFDLLSQIIRSRCNQIHLLRFVRSFTSKNRSASVNLLSTIYLLPRMNSSFKLTGVDDAQRETVQHNQGDVAASATIQPYIIKRTKHLHICKMFIMRGKWYIVSFKCPVHTV